MYCFRAVRRSPRQKQGSQQPAQQLAVRREVLRSVARDFHRARVHNTDWAFIQHGACAVHVKCPQGWHQWTIQGP